MNLIQKVGAWLYQKGTFPKDEASFGGLTHSQWLRVLGGGRTYTGKTVDDTTAMQMSAVWACVRVLSESVGMLPWAVYERGKDGNATKVDHALADVLAGSPNADMTDVELKETEVVNLALQGNAYALKETRGNGDVSSLYPVPSNTVQPQRSQEGIVSYKVLDRGKWEVYPREKIWHVKGFGSNGLIGYSPIGYVRQAIGLGLALEEFNARFFNQGARTSGVVSVPDWLKKEQREEARKVLNQMYSGVENAHKIMLLEGGMTYSATTMPLEDAQFMKAREMQVDEICRIYRVPPHMVAKLDRATFSNIEQQSIEFAVYSLQPYLVRIERSAQRWLLKPADRSRFFVKFNLEGLLRADTAARGAFYAQMLQNGVYNRNEVRALENMNRVEGQGMDDYTVQSNMAPIEALAALLAGKQQAQQKPAAPAKSNVLSFSG